uniref:Glucosidase II subunit alpha n=1 Tax=Acrobeloides nanus TaxID=290746 RepID=A0A914CV67_9BILA
MNHELTDADKDKDSASFVTPTGEKIVLTFKPFRIDVFIKKELTVSINSKNLLKFEHFREKGAADTDEEGFWEESFKSFQDSKPYGSSSVGVDISFLGYKFIYGIPNADTFALRSTTNSEPYRFYNLDVFEYELNNPMALYGSIPYVIAHNQHQTLSLLWLNSAETWADIHSSTADKGMLASIVDKFRPSSEVPQIDVHFISETGVIDLFLFLGPKPKDVFRQYASLTGVTPLPPQFAIAYHQCRWNYKDEADVAGVHAGFDEHDIPFDVIWLDIEYTDGKKYFTWDSTKFPTPKEMQNQLAANGRKLVTIIDPHIKKDSGYHIYKEAQDLGYFVKKSNGDDYEGHCWPGASSYLDYMNPTVRDWWASQYALDKFAGSTENLWIWNDMNEPSVFSGPETTMEKDAKHYGGWEHREVHNIYGLMMHMSTHQGLLQRSNKRLRPFILTRSFFAGTQRTAAVWTGDNAAEWSHLKSTVPMLLKMSTSGIPFVGADVGGFFKNPDEQLLVRWYQAGAFQPFFRAHAHIDTRRREPWLFSEQTKDAIKKAIKARYRFLPYWYTLFYEHEKTGLPIMRPVWAEFPEDENSFDEEREWLVGNALLVRPVMDPDVTQTSLYLPGLSEVWYEWDSHKSRPGPGAVYIDTPIDKIPVYQRGGTIIPVRERPRRASKLMRNDPITLYIATNYKDFANGTLYMDDGETFEYKNGDYLYWGFTFKKINEYDFSISSKNLDTNGKFDPDVWIEKIVIRG